MTTPAEQARINQTARLTRTQREEARMESEAKGPAKKKKPKKKKHVEQGSTRGTSNAEINAGAERLMQPLREQLRAAVLAGNKARAGKLRERLLAVQASKL